MENISFSDYSFKDLLNIAKPIAFNTEMVNAIWNKEKTNTRRIEKRLSTVPNTMTEIIDYNYLDGQYTVASYDIVNHRDSSFTLNLKYNKGDFLYVRERWLMAGCCDKTKTACIVYASDNTNRVIQFEPERYNQFKKFASKNCWNPPMFMPKEAARYILQVGDVKIEKFSDIFADLDEVPSILSSEGIGKFCKGCNHKNCSEAINASECNLVKKWYVLWDSTVDKKDMNRYGTKTNPWVSNITFSLFATIYQYPLEFLENVA